LASSYNYIANAWKIYIEDPSYEERVEYRIPQWVSENLPEARVYSEDSIRFWFNVWQDLPQLTGGSHQGMLNQNLGAAEWNLRVRSEGEWAIEWMQAFGVSAAVVSDETSPANLGTLVHPGKLDGLLPVLHRNGLGEAIYEVPRRFLARARVVEEAVVRELPPITEGWQRDHLQAYVRAVEEGPDSPVSLEWLGPETMLVRLSLEPGQLLLIQESYDPSWHAYSGETEFEVREDVLGQMLVLAPPGQHELLMQFELPLENLLGRIISAAAAFFVLVLLFSGAKGRQANRSS
jgi:hypothetical protein